MVRKWYKRGQICGVSDCLDGQRSNGYDVRVTLDRQASKCRLYLAERCSIFLSKSCTLHRKSTGASVAAEDSVHILGNGGSQDPEFQKEYLKLVDEEPTPGMPNETQKLVRELPRYGNRRAPQSRISDQCRVARPCNLLTCANQMPRTTLIGCQPLRRADGFAQMIPG
jgi:hypothetical protein